MGGARFGGPQNGREQQTERRGPSGRAGQPSQPAAQPPPSRGVAGRP